MEYEVGSNVVMRSVDDWRMSDVVLAFQEDGTMHIVKSRFRTECPITTTLPSKPSKVVGIRRTQSEKPHAEIIYLRNI